MKKGEGMIFIDCHVNQNCSLAERIWIEPVIAGSKPVALPLGYHSIYTLMFKADISLYSRCSRAVWNDFMYLFTQRKSAS